MKNNYLSNKISNFVNVSWLWVMVLIIKLPISQYMGHFKPSLSIKWYCNISKLYSVWKNTSVSRYYRYIAQYKFYKSTICIYTQLFWWLFSFYMCIKLNNTFKDSVHIHTTAYHGHSNWSYHFCVWWCYDSNWSSSCILWLINKIIKIPYNAIRLRWKTFVVFMDWFVTAKLFQQNIFHLMIIKLEGNNSR